MNLKYELKYDHEAIIGDKIIKFREWTTKEERQYLKLIEKQENNITDKMLFDILIKPCIEDKKIVLSAIEQKKLLIDIRIESISKYLEDSHICDSCKEQFDIKTELKDLVSYKQSNYDTVTVQDIKITFEEIKNNKDKEQLSLKNGIVDYVYQDFLLHIASIEMNNETYVNLSKKDKETFMDSLPTKIFDEIFEAYQSMVDVLDIEYKWVCPNCNNEEVIDYTYIPNFLWA